MLELFERAIADGAGPEQLEHIRDQLRQGVDADRLRRLEQIENDYQTAKLIQFGLQQDRGSIPFSVAAGFKRWFRKKYSDDGDLAAEIMREMKRQTYEEQREKQKGEKRIVKHAGEPSETSGKGAVERGAIGPAKLFTGVPSAEPGESPRVEPELLGTESGSDGPG